MFNPFNTLFGRLALLTIGLIVLVHGTTQLLFLREIGQIDTEQAKRGILLAVYARSHSEAPASEVINTLGIHYVDAKDVIRSGCPAPCSQPESPFDETLLGKLPSGSRAVSDDATGDVWVRYGEAPYWLRLGGTLVPRVWALSVFLLTLVFAVMIALAGAWQLQRPLRRLAEATRRFRCRRQFVPVPETGPAELRALTADFNGMTAALVHAEQERAEMLAGIAHDLKAPISRMMVRAELLEDDARREGFQRDAEALLRIVTQFQDYAREAQTDSTWMEVDGYCSNFLADGSSRDTLAIRCDLQAGEGFVLPMVDLERILSNLLGNVSSYGAGPVEITTRCCEGSFQLQVRDHGPGIPAEQLEAVLRPFVRLDRERGGEAHCGLGLSIVRKLTQANGGQVECSNAPDGGLMVSLCFPRNATSGETDAGNCG